jgi:hypothetical protein
LRNPSTDALQRCTLTVSRQLSDGEVGATPDTVFNEEDEQ